METAFVFPSRRRISADDREVFGQWLSEKRAKKGVDQWDVATTLSQWLGTGWPQTRISGIERGTYKSLSRRDIVLLAVVVGADPVEGLEVAGQIPPSS